MKKWFFYIAFILTGFACKNNTQDQFTVHGTISSASGELIVLEKILESTVIGVDSTILSDDGTFELKGNSAIPCYYSLRIDNNNTITLILKAGENAEIIADKEGFRSNYQISGSKDSELLKELDNTFNLYYGKLISLNQKYDNIKYSENHANIDELRKELEKEYQTILTDYRKYIMKFIDDNLTSMASFSALFQAISQQDYLLNPYDDYEYFKKVDSALTILYPTSGITKFMNESMLQVEEQRKYMQQKQRQLSYGNTVPDIALPSPTGDTILLSSLKGKYVLLDFWASWCAPCRQENPNLVNCYKKFSRKNFTIFQVSLDRDKNSWTQAIKDDKLSSWYHVSDLMMWNSVVVPVYNIQGIPTNYLLDKEGRIVAKDLRGEKLDQVLTEIFNK